AADRLDPDAGRIVEAVWFDRGAPEPGRLLLVVHHLAVDGVSWRVLVDDLRDAWDAVRAGNVPALDPVGAPLRAYARGAHGRAGHAARVAEFEHWAGVLAPGGELDPTASSAGLTAGSMRRHEVHLPNDVAGPLFTSGEDVTGTLVAALHLAVARW